MHTRVCMCEASHFMHAHTHECVRNDTHLNNTVIKISIFFIFRAIYFCYIPIVNEVEVFVNSVSHALNEDRVLNFSRQMASVIQFKMAHHQAAYLALFICCLKV